MNYLDEFRGVAATLGAINDKVVITGQTEGEIGVMS